MEVYQEVHHLTREFKSEAELAYIEMTDLTEEY